MTSERREGQEGDFIAVPSEVLATAAHLAEQLGAALRRLEVEGARTSRGDLNAELEALRTEHTEIQALLTESLSDDQLEQLAELLEAWKERPNDLLVMVKVAEKSHHLNRLVRALIAARARLAGQ